MTAMRAGRLRSSCCAAALAALAAVLPSGAESAERAPPVRGDAALLVDAGTGETLLARRADRRHAIASTTKLMTALLALERARPNDVFTAPAYDAGPLESQIRLRKGERMKVADLLRALLLESANDAAVTIAENVSGSRSAFVADMNARAAELGLRGTSYENPIGFDGPDNHSTARDLASLARRLLRNRRFAAIVDMPVAKLRSGARRRVISNRNRLVRTHQFVDGVKTGHTREAGYVLVGSASRAGARVVSVVLGEPSESARDADTLALLRWGLDQFRKVRAVVAGRTLARAEVEHFDDRRVGLEAERGVTLTLRRGERAHMSVDAPEELEGPLPAGRPVGTVDIVYRGRVVRTVPLVTGESVPEAGTLRKLGGALGWAVAAVAFAAVAAAVLTVIRRSAARGREVRR
jgi:D-alanyl-D-alanine carboxypeptidase (penicillin-binding protein 5/6)